MSIYFNDKLMEVSDKALEILTVHELQNVYDIYTDYDQENE